MHRLYPYKDSHQGPIQLLSFITPYDSIKYYNVRIVSQRKEDRKKREGGRGL